MPDGAQPSEIPEAWEFELIRREAEVFASRVQLNWMDGKDLAQEGWIAWLRQRPRYDQAQGASKETYLKRVVRHRFLDIEKAERAQARRASYQAVSLNATAEDMVPLEELLADHGIPTESSLARRLDLETALSMLNGRQRVLLEGLSNGYRIQDIARRLGVHRDTLYEDRKRIQQIFRANGLHGSDS